MSPQTSHLRWQNLTFKNLIMKQFKLIALLFSLSFLANAQSSVTDTLVMIWNDEFEGTSIDNSKWDYCPNWFRQGGSYWADENAWVDGNGLLKLNVTESNDSVYCGAIRTHNKYNQQYGYFEVSCKVPQIQGGWAAFWMMPYGNKVGDQGDDGTELDIFESINGWNGKIQHALHWDGYGAEHQSDKYSMTNWGLYDGDFHKFGMMWTPQEYIFYIDDVETWRTSAGGVADVEQYMKLTMEVSNQTWPGDWDNQTTKPITWAIDYVRTYAYGIKKPVVSFTLPDDNKIITLGNTQSLKALVDGSYDYLTTMEFYAQKEGESEELIKIRNIGATSDSLFYTPWTPSEPGNYTITVKGKKDGETLTTATISASVEDISTGIEVLSQEITIYPNPGSDFVNLSKTAQEVEIFNANGQPVLTAWNTSKIDVRKLQSGNYFMIIDKYTLKKLVIKPRG